MTSVTIFSWTIAVVGGRSGYMSCFFQIHIQKHIANPYQCKQCVERFPTRRKLQVHVRIHPDYFKCEQCLKTFYSSKNLSRHKKIHEASFVCEECGRKFHHNYLLKKHIDHDHKGKIIFTFLLQSLKKNFFRFTKITITPKESDVFILWPIF